MKKVLYGIVTIFMMMILIPITKAEKVPVYIFSKDGCSACETAFEYFDDLQKKEEDLFDQYVIEVFDGNWQIEDDQKYELLINVLEAKGEDTNPENISTPIIVIGDYLTRGFPNDSSVVYNAITTARDSEDVKDYVKDEAEKLSINLEDYKKVIEKNNTGIIVAISIFVILLGCVGGLILLCKKK